MKKICMTILAFALAAGLFAQDGGEDTSYFCVTIPAVKIYTHSKGYVFTYRKNSLETGRIYLPYTWFKREADNEMPKASTRALPAGPVWPYLTIFYQNGEFSHVKLSIRREPLHDSWGIIYTNANLDSEFDNAGEPKLEFGYGQ